VPSPETNTFGHTGEVIVSSRTALHASSAAMVLAVTGTWRDFPNLLARIVITALSWSMSLSASAMASPTRMPVTASKPIRLRSITARWTVRAEPPAQSISAAISASVNR